MTYIRTEYPSDAIVLALKRTKELMNQFCLQQASLPMIIASAYLQGICDLVETQEDQPNDKD